MTREIKFDIISKQVGSDKLHHNVMTLEEIESAEPDYLDYEVVARRQYIGLKDQLSPFGQDIYDQDIIATDIDIMTYYWLVGWNEDHVTGMMGWCVKDLQTHEWYALDRSIQAGKVVGNLFDSPELIK